MRFLCVNSKSANQLISNGLRLPIRVVIKAQDRLDAWLSFSETLQYSSNAQLFISCDIWLSHSVIHRFQASQSVASASRLQLPSPRRWLPV